jgi:hypothetical protein
MGGSLRFIDFLTEQWAASSRRHRSPYFLRVDQLDDSSVSNVNQSIVDINTRTSHDWGLV